MTRTNKNARDDRASVLRKVENNDARGKKKAHTHTHTHTENSMVSNDFRTKK